MKINRNGLIFKGLCFINNNLKYEKQITYCTFANAIIESFFFVCGCILMAAGSLFIIAVLFSPIIYGIAYLMHSYHVMEIIDKKGILVGSYFLYAIIGIAFISLYFRGVVYPKFKNFFSLICKKIDIEG